MDNRVVILGAGPSGLGVAWGLLERGFTNITLIEKKTQPGGLSGTIHYEGLSFDYGPHRLSPEYPDIVERLKELVGTDWETLPNEHAVVFRDHIYHYPPRAKEFLDWDTIRFSSEVLGSYVCGRFRLQPANTFREKIEKTFGSRLYKEVVSPLCEKVWGDPNDLDPSFAETRFSIPTFVQWGKRWLGDPRASRDKWFHYPKKGFQQFWDQLAILLKEKGVQLLMESFVSEIARDGFQIKGVKVTTVSGVKNIPADVLVTTIPSKSFLPLLKAKEDFVLPTSRGMILIGFLIQRERNLPARVVLLPERKYLFNRLSEQSQFSSAMVPQGKSVVLADILALTTDSLWQQSDSDLKEAVKKQLLELQFFEEKEVEKVFLIRVPEAYPVPSRQNEIIQRSINGRLGKYKNLYSTGRLASSDYNNSHSALKKGLELADFISQKKRPVDWYPYAEKLRHVPIRD